MKSNNIQENMEKEFDKMFGERIAQLETLGFTHGFPAWDGINIKQFIAKTLKDQREQMIKVIEKRIVMKLPAFPPKNKNIINNIKKLKLFSIKDLEELLKELKNL